MPEVPSQRIIKRTVRFWQEFNRDNTQWCIQRQSKQPQTREDLILSEFHDRRRESNILRIGVLPRIAQRAKKQNIPPQLPISLKCLSVKQTV